jgi:hypothetical protein
MIIELQAANGQERAVEPLMMMMMTLYLITSAASNGKVTSEW